MDNKETEIGKRFKELEISITQVLGLVDPHFQRVVGNLMGKCKDDIINIINEVAVEEKK